MKSNNLFTYVIGGALALFITIAGYYTCQKQKAAKIIKEQDAAELENTLRQMREAEEDTTASIGSSFARDTLNNKGSRPNVSKDGIVQEPSGTAPAKPGVKTPTGGSPTTTVKPVVKKTSKGVKGPGSGRWAVRAGTFAYMEGARRRLEEVIKAGFPNAEISKTNEGKAAVVVFRSNNKTAAINVVDKLEEKGIDAAVFDRKN
jgi:SPOR domain